MQQKNIKNISQVDTSSFSKKVFIKTEVEKLDIGKLTPIPVDLSKLSDVVKNDVAKVDNTDTSDLVC